METKEIIALYRQEIESEAAHLRKVTKTNDQVCDVCFLAFLSFFRSFFPFPRVY
jgi:hypothetical protein